VQRAHEIMTFNLLSICSKHNLEGTSNFEMAPLKLKKPSSQQKPKNQKEDEKGG
jgi:hypothetical protein